MVKSKTDRRLAVLFYTLSVYIVLQFSWWAYLLISLNGKLYFNQDKTLLQNKIWMVIGEGSVFLLILLTGIYIMQRTIRKEIGLVRQQRNFLLSVTHELKTPLAAIKLCLETLSKHRELKSGKIELLQQNALDNAERLNILLDNVLLATQIDSGGAVIDDQQTDLSEKVLAVVSSRLKTYAGHNLVSTDIVPGINAFMEGHNFEIVFGNLLDNALKYGEGSKIHISLMAEGPSAVLIVKDEGPGIPTDQLKLVFEKFYRVGNEETRAKKGTGLGLYIAKELVSSSGGKIQASANSPKGVQFKVSLPQNRS